MIYGLIIVIILILTFCFWFLISFRKNTLTLFFMIPIIFGSIVLGHLTYKQILGYPTELKPVGKYRLVSFYVVPKTDIYLWIIKPEEIIPRAYRIDYSKSNRKKLHGSYKSLKKGNIMIINFPNNEKDEGKFVLYKLPMPKWLKKDTENSIIEATPEPKLKIPGSDLGF